MLCKKPYGTENIFIRILFCTARFFITRAFFKHAQASASKIFSFFQPLIKLYVEILILVIWFEIESVHHKKVQISDQIWILSIVQYFLHIQQKIMPVID